MRACSIIGCRSAATRNSRRFTISIRSKFPTPGRTAILLELISGGHDAEIRHRRRSAARRQARPSGSSTRRRPSILASIAKKLPIVAISRDFLAFEDEFATPSGSTRCWVTLLPLSAGGAWVDYVYALVSLDVVSADAAETAKAAAKKAKPAKPVADESAEPVEAQPAEEPEAAEVAEEPVAEEAVVEEAEEPTEPQAAAESVAEQAEEAVADPPPRSRPPKSSSNPSRSTCRKRLRPLLTTPRFLRPKRTRRLRRPKRPSTAARRSRSTRPRTLPPEAGPASPNCSTISSG